ncbi:hypothetical protein O9993_05920 [Vibrio lentus]|nr:hypothetical protein [Vibrio lentus]
MARVTDAEQGFMDYLSQHVDVRFTILDARIGIKHSSNNTFKI